MEISIFYIELLYYSEDELLFIGIDSKIYKYLLLNFSETFF